MHQSEQNAEKQNKRQSGFRSDWCVSLVAAASNQQPPAFTSFSPSACRTTHTPPTAAVGVGGTSGRRITPRNEISKIPDGPRRRLSENFPPGPNPRSKVKRSFYFRGQVGQPCGVGSLLASVPSLAHSTTLIESDPWKYRRDRTELHLIFPLSPSLRVLLSYSTRRNGDRINHDFEFPCQW